MLKWATCLVALFFWGSALADLNAPNQPRLDLFPGSSIILQDGDIILNTPSSILGALNSQYGFPRGRYAHAMVYVKGSNSAGVLLNYSDEGLEVRQDIKLTLSNELALVRPKKAPLPNALLSAMKQLGSKNLSFDYDMRWPPIDSNTTYCAGFISQLFRLADMPDPFPPNSQDQVSENFMGQWAIENLGLDLKQTVSPNKILSLTDYELVAVYKPDDITGSRSRIVAGAVARKIQRYIENEGMQQKPPSIGSQFLIGMTNMGMMDRSILARMPEKRRKPLVHLLEFFSLVEARVKRHVYLHNDVTWKEQEIEEITQMVADQYRDRFFSKSSTN